MKIKRLTAKVAKSSVSIVLFALSLFSARLIMTDQAYAQDLPYCTAADYAWQNKCLSNPFICNPLGMLVGVGNTCSACDLKCKDRDGGIAAPSVGITIAAAQAAAAAAARIPGDILDTVVDIGGILYRCVALPGFGTISPKERLYSCAKVGAGGVVITVSVAVPPVGAAIAGGSIISGTVDCALACSDGGDPDACKRYCAGLATNSVITIAGAAAAAGGQSAIRPGATTTVAIRPPKVIDMVPGPGGVYVPAGSVPVPAVPPPPAPQGALIVIRPPVTSVSVTSARPGAGAMFTADARIFGPGGYVGGGQVTNLIDNIDQVIIRSGAGNPMTTTISGATSEPNGFGLTRVGILPDGRPAITHGFPDPRINRVSVIGVICVVDPTTGFIVDAQTIEDAVNGGSADAVTGEAAWPSGPSSPGDNVTVGVTIIDVPGSSNRPPSQQTLVVIPDGLTLPPDSPLIQGATKIVTHSEYPDFLNDLIANGGIIQ